MSKMCGHCLRRFPTRYVSSLIWCKEENIYVCRRCWEDVCGEGHGKGQKNISMHTLNHFLIVTFLFSFVVSFVFVALIDIIYVNTWNNMEYTDIKELPESGWVKLKGTLVGDTGEAVVTGHGDKSSDDGDWEWDEDIRFILEDKTGNITIYTSKYYDIMDGPHDVINSDSTEGTTYLMGDRVKAICEVKTDGDIKRIYLLWLGTEDQDCTVQILSYFILAIFLLPATIGYVYVLILTLKRGALHKKKVEYKNEITIRDTDMKKDKSLTWMVNSSSSHLLANSISITLLITGFLILILIIFLFQSTLHTISHYWSTSLFGLLMCPFLFTLPSFVLFERGSSSINELSVSGRGVHFFYTDPIVRYLKDDFIGWDEMKDVCYRKVGKSGNWLIEKKNNTNENINGLTEKNRKWVLAGWEQWKKIMGTKLK